MGLGETQFVVARTLETQAIFQQAISASELALRQTEKNLADERTRQQDLVAGSEASQPGDDAGMNLDQRPTLEKTKRYRLTWKRDLGASLEIEQNFEFSRPGRLDIRA